MGSTVLLPTSFRMTIAILVTGSIMSPRIFISTSMRSLPFLIPLHHTGGLRIEHALAHQRVRSGARDPHVEIAAHQCGARIVRMREIERPVLRSASDPLA